MTAKLLVEKGLLQKALEAFETDDWQKKLQAAIDIRAALGACEACTVSEEQLDEEFLKEFQRDSVLLFLAIGQDVVDDETALAKHRWEAFQRGARAAERLHRIG